MTVLYQFLGPIPSDFWYRLRSFSQVLSLAHQRTPARLGQVKERTRERETDLQRQAEFAMIIMVWREHLTICENIGQIVGTHCTQQASCLR